MATIERTMRFVKDDDDGKTIGLVSGTIEDIVENVESFKKQYNEQKQLMLIKLGYIDYTRLTNILNELDKAEAESKRKKKKIKTK